MGNSALIGSCKDTYIAEDFSGRLFLCCIGLLSLGLSLTESPIQIQHTKNTVHMFSERISRHSLILNRLGFTPVGFGNFCGFNS